MKSNETFLKEIYQLVGDEYTPLEEYKGTNTKILMKHNTCGHEWMVTPNSFLNGNTRCPKHRYERIRKSKTKDTSTFKKDVKELVGDEYTVLGEYKNGTTEILMKHNTCGNEFKIKPTYFLNQNSRCPECKNIVSNKRTTEEVRNEIWEKFNGEFILIDEYTDTNTYMEFIHNKGNILHKFKISYANLMKRGRCTVCNPANVKMTNEEFQEKLTEKNGKDYVLIGDYIDNKTHVIVKHLSCGNEYSIRPVDILHPNTNGNKDKTRECPFCSNVSISKTEIEVQDYVKEIIGDKYKIILNDRTILEGKELDIYIPELNKAIEFDGLYWHNEEMLNGDRNYHLNKTIKCNEKGIQLIHIFENEWNENKTLVKKKIKHILNLNENKRIFGRKCYIKEVTKDSKKEFLIKNHIQGNDTSSLALGLFNSEDDKLVSVMTFGKTRISLGRKSTEGSYELIRFASDNDLIVVGGFSKLFKYFTRNYEFNEIITYADLRWSVGNIYEKNGFTRSHISKPNYWYFHNDNKLKHRYGFTKQKIAKKFPKSYDKDKTEYQIMLEEGYKRIWDCGNIVYKYTN